MSTRAKVLKGGALVGVATLIASVSGMTFAGTSASAKTRTVPAPAVNPRLSAAEVAAAVATKRAGAHETVSPGLTRAQALSDKALHYTDLRGARPTAAAVDALRAKAVKAGSVRVLVGVAARYAPQGILTAAEVTAQRGSIASLQQQVANAATPKGAKILYTYDANVPTVAMTATPAALDALRNSSAVASIHEDIADAPTLEQSTPQVGAADAHDRGFRGSGWTVAVLDTGADSNHEFLTGATVE